MVMKTAQKQHVYQLTFVFRIIIILRILHTMGFTHFITLSWIIRMQMTLYLFLLQIMLLTKKLLKNCKCFVLKLICHHSINKRHRYVDSSVETKDFFGQHKRNFALEIEIINWKNCSDS